MVAPTNVQPRLLRSFDSATDSGEAVSRARMPRVMRPGREAGSGSKRQKEAPEVGRERAELLAQFEGALRVVDGGFDLAAVADDSAVFGEPRGVARREAGHALEVETGEGAPEVFALVENRPPAQPALETFQADLLEQAHVVPDGEAPLVVVIGHVGGVGGAPEATEPAVGTLDETGLYFRRLSSHAKASSCISMSRMWGRS